MDDLRVEDEQVGDDEAIHPGLLIHLHRVKGVEFQELLDHVRKVEISQEEKDEEIKEKDGEDLRVLLVVLGHLPRPIIDVILVLLHQNILRENPELVK